MIIYDFIKSKPAELRLGQHFVNSYCKPVNGVWNDNVTKLFYLSSDFLAELEIQHLMALWQWDELPELKDSK